MAMVATVVDTVDMAEDTTARGMLMPRLPPPLRLMPSLAMATTAVDMAVMVTDVSMVDTVDTAEDTTARGRLMLRPSPDMDTTAVDTDMVATDTDVSMVDTADTTERGPLMLRPSPDMDTTAVAMDMVATDTDVSMVDTADTTDKLKSDRVNLYSFTATFILVLKLSLVLPQNFLK